LSRKKTFLSIIDDGFSVEGTIEFTGELLIRGRVGGKVKGDTVTIAEEGMADADMIVHRLTVGGRFQGNAHVDEELVVLATGQCDGSVQCRNIIVHEGGRLNADVRQLNHKENYREKKLSAPTKPVIDL
jgi:cytoskeletal protein CcmA (bactofilin family)